MRFAFGNEANRPDEVASTSGVDKKVPFVFTASFVGDEAEEVGRGAVSSTQSPQTPPTSRHDGRVVGLAKAVTPSHVDLQQELELYDRIRRANAACWFEGNARRDALERELKEVMMEETQDLKSSIFSVQEQKDAVEREIRSFVSGEKRARSALMDPLKVDSSGTVRALGSRLREVEEEIHKAKHQKRVEAAKREEERRREQERRRAEEEVERARRAEEERAERAEAERVLQATREAERRRAEAAEAERRAAEAREREERESKVPAGTKMAPGASKWQRTCAAVYEKHKDLAKVIFQASKLERLKLEKPLKKAVNQLSCSRQQIRFVGGNVTSHLSNQHQQGQHLYSYCLVRLGDLIAAQAPGLGAAKQLAFAYAELVAMVSDAGFEDLTFVLFASLHRSCPLAVPGLPKSYEGDLTEIKGYISLLAAVCQRQNPDWCWSYQARFLNHLPATERTALALDAFLQIAGHALHTKFRRQQDKVFACVRQGFVRSLGQAKGSEDVDAVKSRIEKYVDMRVFASAPKDSHIPETDESTHIRC